MRKPLKKLLLPGIRQAHELYFGKTKFYDKRWGWKAYRAAVDGFASADFSDALSRSELNSNL